MNTRWIAVCLFLTLGLASRTALAADAPVGPPAVEDREKARAMPAPLVLTTPDAVVKLSGPLSFSGTAFYVAAPNVTIDLNGHTVFFGTDDQPDRHGVHLYYDFSDAKTVTTRITPNGQPDRVRITGGCLVHAGKGANCHAINGQRTGDGRLDNLRCEVYGEDSATVYFRYGGCRIVQCVLISHADRSADRHAGPANVRVPEGPVIATENLLIGGNSGFNVGNGSQIERNVISHDSHVTNGYGVWLYRKDHVNVKDNLIVPSAGRGVLLNAGTHNTIQSNVIVVREHPNEEYGEGLNAAGVRLRYEAVSNRVENNTIVAIGGSDWTGGSCLYMTNTAKGVNTLRDNTCLAVLLKPPQNENHYAKALTFEMPEPDPNYAAADEIYNNRLLSNHWIVSTSGPDGGCHQGPIIGNELSWIDGAGVATALEEATGKMRSQLRLNEHIEMKTLLDKRLEEIGTLLKSADPGPNRKTLYCGFYDWMQRLMILDSTGDAGLALADVIVQNPWPAPIEISIGKTHAMVLRDKNSQPLSGINVSCTSDQKDRFVLRTQGNGNLALPVIAYAFVKRGGDANAPLEQVDRKWIEITPTGMKPQKFEINAIPETIDFEK